MKRKLLYLKKTILGRFIDNMKKRRIESPQFWVFDPQNLSLPILMTIAVTYLKEK